MIHSPIGDHSVYQNILNQKYQLKRKIRKTSASVRYHSGTVLFSRGNATDLFLPGAMAVITSLIPGGCRPTTNTKHNVVSSVVNSTSDLDWTTERKRYHWTMAKVAASDLFFSLSLFFFFFLFSNFGMCRSWKKREQNKIVQWCRGESSWHHCTFHAWRFHLGQQVERRMCCLFKHLI